MLVIVSCDNGCVFSVAKLNADICNNNIPDLTNVGKHNPAYEENFAIEQERLPHWSAAQVSTPEPATVWLSGTLSTSLL